MGWQLGEIAVSAIVDEDCFDFPLERIFPHGSVAALAGETWLEPDHVDLARGMVKLGMHSFLLRTPSLNILVDTCIGAHKQRPAHAAWHQRQSPRFLENLAREGLSPDDIDLVFCSHLHADHVGWNTQLLDGRWVPTFPRARYAISEHEFAEWRRLQAESDIPVNHGAYTDSLLPVVETGQAMFVSPGDPLVAGLSIVPLAGHTTHHMGLEVSSGGARALFCGDAIHSGVQLVKPRWASAFCAHPEQAVATRLAMLDRVAREGMQLFPAHFRGARALRIAAAGDGYRPL